VELCNLNYSPHLGSCIDPHFDDSWLWGERLVTLNLKGSTVLTFSRADDFEELTKFDENDQSERYSLSCQAILDAKHECGQDDNISVEKFNTCSAVHVALPQRSLIIVEGDARFKWQHSIIREHVHQERVAMTCRELSEIFRHPESKEFEAGTRLLEQAKINPLL